jgi:hypothetical protein
MIKIMKQDFKNEQCADYRAGTMDTGDHFKNGANPKSQMNGWKISFNKKELLKTILFLNIGIAFPVFMQSCATMTVAAEHSIPVEKLDEGVSYMGGDVQLAFPLKKWDLVLALGGAQISEPDSQLLEDEQISYSNKIFYGEFGFGASYFFSRKRIQPYIGVDLLVPYYKYIKGNGIDSNEGSGIGSSVIDKNTLCLRPRVGMRCYLSNDVALTFNTSLRSWNNRTLIIPSIGVTFALRKKGL